MNVIDELVAYFDSIEQLYPGGIDVSSGPGDHALRSSSAAVSLAFLSLGSRQVDSWSGDDGELLRKAVVNGMKIPIERVRRVWIEPGSGLDGFRASISVENPQLVVALGSEVVSELSIVEIERGQWAEIDGKRMLFTVSLGEVMKDMTFKRIFWEDLQKVIEELR